jgi:hypothetical protein
LLGFTVVSGSAASSGIAADGDSVWDAVACGDSERAAMPLGWAGGGEIELAFVALTPLLADELAIAAGGVVAAAADSDGEGTGAWASSGSSVGAAATGGWSTTGTLVTSACAANEVFAASAAGRGTKEMITAAPAVAPIAVATSTMRAVRMKLGAGAR